jgi:hypothetical protein
VTVGLAVKLAFNREMSIIAALIALGVAGLVVSIGAWVLLARARRDRPDR